MANRGRRWVAIGIVLVLAALLAWFIYMRTRPTSAPPHPPAPVSVPQFIRSQLTFPIYYPTNLPAGYSVNFSSFRVPEKNVMVFDIKIGGQLVAVSEQALPASNVFDINTFYTNNVANISQFLTGQGQAAVGELSDGRQFGSLVANPTWIIVTAPSSVSPDQVRTILKDMQPLSP